MDQIERHYSKATVGLKTVTLMRRKDGMDRDAFIAEFTGRHAELASRCPDLKRYSQTTVLSSSARPGMPSWDMEIDAIGQLSFEDEQALARFSASPEAAELRAHGLTIVGQQVNFVTKEHVPIPWRPSHPRRSAEQEMKFVALLGRRPEMDRGAFLEAWLDDHARLASGCPEIAQFVLTRIDSSNARPGLPSWDVSIDGMAELYFSDADALQAFNAAATTKAFRAHGEIFIGRQINLVTRETIVIPKANG